MVVEAKAAVEAPPVVVVVPAVPVAEEHGGLRLPGAPAAPAAAGGSGCWACCSPGCCCWVCSSALLLWVGAKVTEPERSAQPFSPFLETGNRKQSRVLGSRSWRLLPSAKMVFLQRGNSPWRFLVQVSRSLSRTPGL